MNTTSCLSERLGNRQFYNFYLANSWEARNLLHRLRFAAIVPHLSNSGACCTKPPPPPPSIASTDRTHSRTREAKKLSIIPFGTTPSMFNSYVHVSLKACLPKSSSQRHAVRL